MRFLTSGSRPLIHEDQGAPGVRNTGGHIFPESYIDRGDAGGKFASGVSDSGGNFVASVIDKVVNNDSNIRLGAP